MILYKYIFVLFIVIIFFTAEEAKPEEIKYSLVEIFVNSEDDLDQLQHLSLNFENTEILKDKTNLIVNLHELESLKKYGIEYEMIIDDLERHYSDQAVKYRDKANINLSDNFQLGSVGGFHTLEEIDENMERMATNYPQYFQEKQEIGKSYEDRDIYAYCFGNISKPEILLTGLHHAREPIGSTAILFFLWKLMELAEAGDQQAIYLLQERAIWVVPMLNPDGWLFNYSRYPDGGGLWRKNRRATNDSTFGVDLNRNYGPEELWNASNNGSSIDPRSDLYRGPYPFSEPETEAVRDFMLERNIRLALNYHSYGNYLIYPYHAIDSETSDSSLFRALSRELSQKNQYSFGTTIQTVRYGARGTSDDWMYLKNNDGNKTIAITPEIGTINDRFYPPPDRIPEQVIDCFIMNWQVCWSAGVNVRPYDLFYDYQQDIKSELVLNIRNVGLEDGDVRVELNSLDTLFTIVSNKIDVFADDSWRQKELRYEIIVNKPHDLITNGETYPFEVDIVHSGIHRRDTFLVKLMCYDEIYLYHNRNQPKPELLWDMDDWGIEYSDDLNHFVLSDSPQAYYQDSANNFMELLEPIELDKPTLLEFTTRWNLEPNDDFAVLLLSTDRGEEWISIKTDRMVKGSGRDQGRQDTSLYGFHGNFTGWVTQRYDLSEFQGKSIILRFGLISDRSAQYDGWYISNIVIREFADCPLLSSVNDEPIKRKANTHICINADEFSLTIPQEMVDSKIEINMYNSFGELDYQASSIGKMIVKVPVSNKSSGNYFIHITNGTINSYHQLLLIK
jgi:carboxypeptidase T